MTGKKFLIPLLGLFFLVLGAGPVFAMEPGGLEKEVPWQVPLEKNRDHPGPTKPVFSLAPWLTDNPAEAAFAGTRFELVFPDISGSIGNNLFNLDYLNADFTGTEGEKRKKEFLAQIDGTGFLLNYASHLQTGLTIGRFSLHLQPWVSGTFNISEGLPYLLFDGLTPNSVYSLSGLGGNGMAAAAVNLSYAHPFRLTDDASLGVGINLRYLYGLGVYEAQIKNGKIETNEIGETEYTISDALYYHGSIDDPGFSGQGIFFDLGALYRQDRWQAGLALRNIGRMRWQGITGERLTGEPLTGRITGGPEGPEFPEEDLEYQAETFSDHSHSLPLVLQVHGSYQVLQSLAASAGMDKALKSGWGYSSKPRFWTSLDWRPFSLLHLGGTIARQGAMWQYQALLELRLWAWWLNLQAGWNGTGLFLEDINGLNISFSSAFHF